MPPRTLSNSANHAPAPEHRRSAPPGSQWPWLCALVGYMALIFAVSHIPNHEFPSEIERLPDKALHALEYLPLGFLWARVVRGTTRRRFFLGWAMAVLFAVSDEIHQAFVPGRSADWLDVLADIAGSGLGAFLCVSRRRSKKTPKDEKK